MNHTLSNTSLLLIALLSTLLTACGGDGGSSFILGGDPSDDDPGTLTLGISDAPVDDAKEVVITVDRVTFRKSGADDVVVEQFTSTDLGITAAETFTIDLLDYQGALQAVVITDQELPSGNYSDLILTILDENINQSYVLGTDDIVRELKVPSGDLKLGGFTIESDSAQAFTVDFNLRQSMAYRTGPADYILKPRGINLVDNSEVSRRLWGYVDTALFNEEADCAAKTDPNSGNVVYLYAEHGLDVDDLADNFDSATSTVAAPQTAKEPYAAVSVQQATDSTWQYSFGFIPAGEYTLVFSCNAGDDDPDEYDALELPLPADQVLELTLTAGTETKCDLPVTNGACAFSN